MKRQFDVTVQVIDNKDETSDFILSLRSTYSTNQIPDYFKMSETIVLEDEQREKYIQMILNFLKNNVNPEQ